MHRVLWGLLALAACQAADDEDADFPDRPRDPEAGKADGAKAIPYKGGPVLHAPREVNIYWGGYWNGAAGRKEHAVLDDFADRAGASDWYQILAEYPDDRGAAGPSALGASVVVDDSEPPAAVSDRGIRKLVSGAIAAGTVDWRGETIYVVFTPPGTVVSTPWGKTCDAICGYHYKFRDGSRDVKYALIPHGDCHDGCSAPGAHANGATLDQMTVTLSHELAEAVTDPDIDAWTGPRGDPEVADLCNSGFVADWDGARFAVQDLWSNAALACVQGP
jgi:hypothetical protein